MEYLDENALREIMMKIENEDDLKNWCETNCKIRKMCKKYKNEWYEKYTVVTYSIEDENKREIKIIGNRKYVIVWYNNGTKKEKREYKNGEREGKWIKWYENRKKQYKVEYKNGKEEGKWIGWWENGTIRYEGEYKDGKRKGKWTEWWENGNKMYEKEYKDGKEEGKWIGWHRDGTNQYEGEYKDGKEEGKWIWWYAGGKKWYEGEYSNGERCGIWKVWNEDGILKSWEDHGSCGKKIESISPCKKSKKEKSQKKCAAKGKMQNTIMGGCRRKCKVGKEKIGSDGKCTKR